MIRKTLQTHLTTQWICVLTLVLSLVVFAPLYAVPLRIMPLGDSITAGYTDNPTWNVPFEFGYRSRLYTLLTNAGYDFVFVGGSLEPFNNLYGDPTKGGTVSPTLDLRTFGQNGHRGYGGVTINTTNTNVASYITSDTPDVILLMIGINGISTSSPGQLDTLANSIFTAKSTVKLVTAQIIPKIPYTSLVVDYNTYIRNTLLPKYIGLGKSITTVDQYANFLTNPADNTSINTAIYANAINHPNATGYNAMADTWYKGILTIIPPTLPVLSQTQFLSSIAPAATIGSFAQPPSPSTETLSFSLITGTGDTDNAKFSISGNQLRAGTYNFNSDPAGTTYTIRVRATGNTGGRVGERIFTLSLISDTDADQLPDSWEMAKAGNLTSLTQSGDFDHDGLTDTAEYNLSLGAYPNIDPTKADTDGDGLDDGVEISGAAPRPPTNPTKADTDGDLICDANENNTGVYVSTLKTGTNPTIADTDGDGRSDGLEIVQNTNPNLATSPASPTSTSVNTTSATQIYASSVSNTDLLTGLTGVHVGWYTGNSADPVKLNDGLHGDYGTTPVQGGWSQASGSTSTYTLPTGSGSGWDISSITTIADWSGGGFGNQHYDVAVRRVWETSFSTIASINYQPFTSTGIGGSKVVISQSAGKLAIGVAEIRFTMLSTNGSSNRSVYREFDVQGTATVPPAPSTSGIQDSRTSRSEVSINWLSWPGKTYRVESSQNLKDWSVLSATYPSGGVTTRFIESLVPLSRAKSFYRVSANP